LILKNLVLDQRPALLHILAMDVRNETSLMFGANQRIDSG
jgi:hypothetical protein